MPFCTGDGLEVLLILLEHFGSFTKKNPQKTVKNVQCGQRCEWWISL